MKNYTLRLANARVKHFFLIAVGALLIFTGCKKDDDGPVRYTQIKFVNAILSSTGLDMYLDDSRKSENVGFGAGTQYFEVTAGNHKVSATPAGSLNPVVINVNQRFDGDTRYSVYGINTNEAIVVADTVVSASINQALVRYINLSPAENNASYVVKQDNSVVPFDFAARPYKQSSFYKAYSPGSYSFTAIDFTNQAGASVNSGPINLTGGKIYTLFLVGRASGSNLALKYIEE